MARGSQLERTVLEIRAKFGERLVSLTERVEGSNSLSSASQTSEPSRDWGERDMDERLNDYSAILTWPDEESEEHPSNIVLVPISHHFLCNYRLTLHHVAFENFPHKVNNWLGAFWSKL